MLDWSRLLSLCPKCASAAIWMPLSGMAIAAIGPSGSKAVPREWRERLGNPRSETVKHVTRCTVGASRGRVVDQWRGAGDISTPCKRQLQLQTSTRSTTSARNPTRMTFSLFSSVKRNNSDFDLESALPHHNSFTQIKITFDHHTNYGPSLQPKHIWTLARRSRR